RLAALLRPVRRRLGAALLTLHYRTQLRRPLDTRLAVFVPRPAPDGQGVDGDGGQPAAIEAALRRLAPHIRTLWLADGPHGLPAGARWLRPGSAAASRALARAAYVVGDGDFPDTPADRPGQRRLQTHRGTPLAAPGLELLDRPAAAPGLDVPRLLRQIDRWHYSLSANRHSTLAHEAAYPAEYTTLEYGSPRADVFHTTPPGRVREIRAALGIPDGTAAVLYAPAPREYLPGRPPRLDTARIARGLGPGFVLLLRRPAGTPAPPPAEGVRDVTGHPLTDLCLAADALVTDYHPVMFDYAGLDRPIIVHADDWETYRAVRGVTFDLPAAPPGPVTRTEEELLHRLTTGLWSDPEAAVARAAFRRRFCPCDDGYAAERVVRRFFLSGHGIPPVVPMAARRPVPAAVRGPSRQPVPHPHRARAPRPLPRHEHGPRHQQNHQPRKPPLPLPEPAPRTVLAGTAPAVSNTPYKYGEEPD
ncbi:CDP-glycerol glycerophosphotransferase family protein, partial [Streptomyces sp. YIM 98790]|uniref:CDP-glycerol glycerophosphotransferase family protein n=1 Tax=Streptomyces sp. YIM 98790 TaxID=2689077 RepID=UPI001A9E191B